MSHTDAQALQQPIAQRPPLRQIALGKEILHGMDLSFLPAHIGFRRRRPPGGNS